MMDPQYFLWSIPPEDTLYGYTETRAVLATALTLSPSPTGTLRVGDWLGYRDTPEATNRALIHTWKRHGRWIRTLHPLQQIPSGRIWIVRWDGLSSDEAFAIHRGLEGFPTYLGSRSLIADDSAITHTLLDTSLGNECVQVHEKTLALPCYLSQEEDCDGSRCAMNAAWVETLTPLGRPLHPYHPAPSAEILAILESLWER